MRKLILSNEPRSRFCVLESAMAQTWDRSFLATASWMGRTSRHSAEYSSHKHMNSRSNIPSPEKQINTKMFMHYILKHVGDRVATWTRVFALFRADFIFWRLGLRILWIRFFFRARHVLLRTLLVSGKGQRFIAICRVALQKFIYVTIWQIKKTLTNYPHIW